MIKMSVTVRTDSLRTYIRNYGLLAKVVSATAVNIEAEAKTSIRKRQSRGNPYVRGERIHYAATPGNPPNQDFGELAGSIQHKMTGPTSAEVRAPAEYAIPLEIGWISKDGKHQGPFPFMVPAVKKHRAAFRMAVAAVLKGGKG